jgi:uncharacterized protein YkwD
MRTFLFPRSAASRRPARAVSLGLSLLLGFISFATARANNNGMNKTGERPVARLISASRQEIPSRARARLVAASAAKSSYTPGAPALAAAATSEELRALDLVNGERARKGLKPLTLDGPLTRLARYHSENMAETGKLNHVDRDGLDLAGRAELLGLRGWKALGENIAYNQGYEDPTAFAVERWMISSKHRENILNGEFTHAGLGIARASDGTFYFTQVFMRR